VTRYFARRADGLVPWSPECLVTATLVALAEERGERRIFTLDADFGIYRLHGRTRFQVVPQP
jgi:hypothetical protein